MDDKRIDWIVKDAIRPVLWAMLWCGVAGSVCYAILGLVWPDRITITNTVCGIICIASECLAFKELHWLKRNKPADK